MNIQNSSLGRIFVGALLALTLGACEDQSSSSAVSGTRSSVEYLELAALGGETDDGGIRVVQRLDIAQSEGWSTKGCKQRLVEKPSGKPGAGTLSLILEEHGSSSELRIPGPFDPATFNRIALRVQWVQKWEVQVELVSGGKRVARSAAQLIAPGGSPRSLLFDLPQTGRLDGKLDAIVLRFTNCRRPLAIRAIDLLQQAEHLFLPSPEHGPRLVKIGSEARRAVGVSASRGLQTKFTNDAAGAALRFSWGVPADLARRGSSSTLQVRVVAEDGTGVVESFKLPADPAKARWHQVLMPLEELPPGVLRAEWSVDNFRPEAAAVCAVGEVTLVQRGSESPLVVLVTSDTHRGDHLGAAAEQLDIDTPRLDALAAEGVLFEDCFSTTNITNPSHIAMMTGVHPRDTGIHNNFTRLSGAAPTLAEAFRKAGYVTYAAISTKHLDSSISGLGQGFERASTPVYDFARDGGLTIDIMDGWLKESEGLPMFLWLHLFDAHMPYGKDTPNVARYYEDRARAFDASLPELDPASQKMINNLRLPGLRDLDYPRALYKAEITELDHKLGEFLEQPAFANAVIAITGDHGESLGNHNVFFAHEELYRDSLHVPLILLWPGAPRGVRSANPVTNLDIGRTLLDLSGNLDVEFPGRNLALAIEEPFAEGARFSLSAHGREAALTEGGWHFQLRLGPNDHADGSVTRVKHQAELYYLPDDPACAQNRLDEQFERASDMRARLLQWLGRSQDMQWLGGDSGDAETLEKLKALGYTGGHSGPSAKLGVPPDCDCDWCERFRQ